MTDDEKRLADTIAKQILMVLTGHPISVASQALCEALATVANRHMPDPESYCTSMGANAVAMIQYHATSQSGWAGKPN